MPRTITVTNMAVMPSNTTTTIANIVNVRCAAEPISWVISDRSLATASSTFFIKSIFLVMVANQ